MALAMKMTAAAFITASRPYLFASEAEQKSAHRGCARDEQHPAQRWGVEGAGNRVCAHIDAGHAFSNTIAATPALRAGTSG